MLVQIAEDLLVGGGTAGKFYPAVQGRAVELDHKFQKEKLTVQPAGIIVVCEGVFERAYGALHACGAGCLEAQDMRRLRARSAQTQAQIVFRLPVSGQKAGGDVEDHPVIHAAGVDHRTVDFAGMNQDNIPGQKRIGTPLDTVGDVAAEENQDLMEIVIMVRKFPLFPVFYVEKTETGC